MATKQQIRQNSMRSNRKNRQTYKQNVLPVVLAVASNLLNTNVQKKKDLSLHNSQLKNYRSEKQQCVLL